ncbi:hypothetical protein TNCV_1351471 [Trichonephila clavipes]|nr:hypothetical protein TNCV_1351471 [Trichonephila clavipes]
MESKALKSTAYGRVGEPLWINGPFFSKEEFHEVQDGNMEHSAGFQRRIITSSLEDMHVTRMALMDNAATSGALSQDRDR